MPPDLTTTTTVVAALRMFPNAVVMPNTGCTTCSACQLITATGLGVITFHHPACPSRVTA
jgi:hypothetical protein